MIPNLQRNFNHSKSLQVDVVDPVGVALDLLLPMLIQRSLEVPNVCIFDEIDKGLTDFLMLGEREK